MNGKDVQVKNTSPDVVNGFYSPLEKVITDSKFDKLPAKQWIEKYANSEEAKWTGLKDWLAQQQGSVSKADIQQYLKDNRIQVVEVVKGSLAEPFQDWSDAEIKDHYEKLDGDPTGKTRQQMIADMVEWESNDLGGAFDTGDAKFQQYQLEGQKENYKEVLVTMPSVDRSVPKMVDAGNGKYYLEFENGNRLFGTYTKSEAESVIVKRKLQGQKSSEVKFQSSHFDEPNILVHLRMNTRTDAEGKKVLFLEEVQSDWGQKGKKEGFRLTEQEAGKAWEEADKKYADFMSRMEKKYGSEWESELTKDEVNEEGKLLDARENTRVEQYRKPPS